MMKLHFIFMGKYKHYVWICTSEPFACFRRTREHGKLRYWNIEYLDMSEQWLYSQIEEHIEDLVFQQDGITPH